MHMAMQAPHSNRAYECNLDKLGDNHRTPSDLNVQRTAYASFNQALYRSITAFGTTSGTIYYQYCPMALENKGGYWLSDSGVVRNPYLGSKMLSCGSTKETIN